MKHLNFIAPVALLLGACSETPIEEQGEEAIAEMEEQIAEDAQSLEEAADEAVRALEEDIDDQLTDEGIGVPERRQPPSGSGN